MKINRRKQYYFCVIIAYVLIICFTLTSCSILRIFGVGNDEEPIIGGDWRTWRGYSNDYVLSDSLSVCFSPLDSQHGEAVYDSSSGARIGTLVLPESLTTDDIKSGYNIEDYNGDGFNDIGITTEDGVLIRYIYDSENAAWPDNIGGCFTRIDADIADIMETESSVEYPFEPYAVEHLNEEQKKLYDEIYPKIIAMEEFSYEAAVCGYDTLDNLFSAWGALMTDYPEINNYFRIWENIDNDGMTVSLDSLYYCVWEGEESNDKEKIRAGLGLFNQECDDIIASMPKDTSTYEKYRYIAIEISKRIQYDYEFEHSGYATPYGIITGYAICQGYAEIYQHLCAKAGLWCRVVEGVSKNTAHGWNLVKLESGTYHVDVTWADEQGEPGKTEWMRYFMLTQEQILVDHEIEDGTEATGQQESFPNN